MSCKFFIRFQLILRKKKKFVPCGALLLGAWFIEGRSRCFHPLLWVTRCVYSADILLDPLVGIVARHEEHGLQEDFASREPIGDSAGGLQNRKMIVFTLKLLNH